MSSFLEEIIKSSCSSEYSYNLVNQDKLEKRIINEISSVDLLTIDDGIKSLDSNIDNWMIFLKKNILEEFEGMKLILRDISKNIIVNEIKRFESEMVQLKNCNLEYQNQISKLNNDLSDSKRTINNLALKFATNKNKFTVAKYMFNWRIKKEQADRQRFCEKISAKFHKTNLMRKAFYGWKHSLEMTWKNRNNSKIERQAQSVCQQLITEYEKQIIQLKSEITKLQDENVTMQTSRSATQDAVKKALMRGVCALNMETMSILNQNGILTEADCDGSNNNCFQNMSNYSNKTKIPSHYSENGEFYDDLPRFPLNKYSRNVPSTGNDTGSYYPSNNCVINGDEKEIKKIPDNSNFHCKTERNQFHVLNHNSHQKFKPNFHNDSGPASKANLSRNSTITVQAGNPTGSHTHSSNSAFNISVQKHVNDTTLPYHGIGHQLENGTEKRYCKK